MNRTVFDDAFGWLQRYYQQNLGQERLDFYFKKLIDIDDDLFAKVIADDVPKRFRSFPTPSEMSDAIIDRRERDYQAVKAVELREPAPIVEMPERTREAADWKKMILEHLATPRSPESRTKLLDQMLEMDSRYPDSGWGDAREGLEQLYIKGGLL